MQTYITCSEELPRAGNTTTSSRVRSWVPVLTIPGHNHPHSVCSLSRKGGTTLTGVPKSPRLVVVLRAVSQYPSLPTSYTRQDFFDCFATPRFPNAVAGVPNRRIVLDLPCPDLPATASTRPAGARRSAGQGRASGSVPSPADKSAIPGTRVQTLSVRPAAVRIVAAPGPSRSDVSYSPLETFQTTSAEMRPERKTE